MTVNVAITLGPLRYRGASQSIFHNDSHVNCLSTAAFYRVPRVAAATLMHRARRSNIKAPLVRYASLAKIKASTRYNFPIRETAKNECSMLRQTHPRSPHLGILHGRVPLRRSSLYTFYGNSVPIHWNLRFANDGDESAEWKMRAATEPIRPPEHFARVNDRYDKISSLQEGR